MRDLFGQVPVSLREIELWLYKVPKLPAGSPRRAAYARGWSVADKIARAKLDGWIHDAIPDELCDFCGQQLCQIEAPAPIAPSDELGRLRRRVAVLEVVLAAVAAQRETPACGRRSLVLTSAS